MNAEATKTDQDKINLKAKEIKRYQQNGRDKKANFVSDDKASVDDDDVKSIKSISDGEPRLNQEI